MAEMNLRTTFGSVSLVCVLLLASCGAKELPTPAVRQNFSISWRTSFQQTGRPIIVDDLFIVPSDSDVMAVSIETGQVEWKYSAPTDMHWICNHLAPFGNRILAVFSSPKGEIYAELSKGGNLLGKRETKDLGSLPDIWDGKWFQALGSSVISEDNSFKIPKSLPLIEYSAGVVYTVTEDGEIQARHEDGKFLWGAKPASRVAFMQTTRQGLLVSCEFETICFETVNGSALWTYPGKLNNTAAQMGTDLAIISNRTLAIIKPDGSIWKKVELKQDGKCVDGTDDGCAVVYSDEIMTFDRDLKSLQTLPTQTGMATVALGPGCVVASGYSQACFKVPEEKK